MKKFIFIILFFPVLLYAQTEAKVLGIPVTLSYKQFISELSQKTKPASEMGFSGETFEEQYFEGTFAGIDSCTFRVVSKNTTGEIEVINISNKEISKSPYYYQSVIGGNNIVALKSLYDHKYGAPVYKKKYKVDSEELEIYVYKAGTTMIEFCIFTKGKDSEDIFATPLAFDIYYFPQRFQVFAADDI